MFKNLKIGVRLGSGFGLIGLLMVSIAYIAIVQLSDLDSTVKNIAQNRWEKIRLANGLLDSVNDNLRILNHMAMIKDTNEIKKEALRGFPTVKRDGQTPGNRVFTTVF